MQTKRAKTGFAGEHYVYSQLILHDKNCFITLGNAKAVDLIIVDGAKRAHYIDVKSTSTSMKNYHKHHDYSNESGLLGRWQLPIEIFWRTHPSNANASSYDYADYYIFHKTYSQNENIIVTKEELLRITHKRISSYLDYHKTSIIEKKHLTPWEFCDYCFEELRQFNNWSKLP